MDSLVRIVVIAELPHLTAEQLAVFEDEVGELIDGAVLSFGGATESIKLETIADEETGCVACGSEDDNGGCSC